MRNADETIIIYSNLQPNMSKRLDSNTDVVRQQIRSINVQKETPLKQVLSNQSEPLRKMIESRFELISMLTTLRVLTLEQAAKLRNILKQQSVYDCNDALLSMMADKSEEDCNKFVLSLETTGQGHVANFVKYNGALPPGNVRPLTKTELSRITDNLMYLEDTIETDHGLLDELHRRNVLSRRQTSFIKECQNSIDRSIQLIDILGRKSFADYMQFIECLRICGQEHIVKVLHSGGGVERISLHDI